MTQFIQQRFIIGGRRVMPDFASAVIAAYSGGFSHVDSIVPAGLPWATEGWLFGARSDLVGGAPRGVQLRPPGYTTYHRCVILTIPVTDQQFEDFWNSQHDKLGKPYDWRSIIAFLAPFGLTRDWHKKDSWICSEASEDSFEAAKILSSFWLAPYKISPGMLAARLEVLPNAWATEIANLAPQVEAQFAMSDWMNNRNKVP